MASVSFLHHPLLLQLLSAAQVHPQYCMGKGLKLASTVQQALLPTLLDTWWGEPNADLNAKFSSKRLTASTCPVTRDHKVVLFWLILKCTSIPDFVS